jgi:hypothetical protein
MNLVDLVATTCYREVSMLTEKEVSKGWQALFKGGEVNDDSLNKAEALLEELRPESPLRHRLGVELEELRKIATAKA